MMARPDVLVASPPRIPLRAVGAPALEVWLEVLRCEFGMLWSCGQSSQWV
jgi:hypothetical protein